MKKGPTATLILAAVLSMTAWWGSNSNNNTAATMVASNTISISPTTELALGTLRLEGTSQAVDQKMSVQLLPNWQLMEELSTNSAAATEEKTAVVENILAIITAGQIKAIQEMKLTQSDVTAALETSGAASAGI